MIGVSEKLEPTFLVLSAIIGAIALVPAYRSKHGRRICLVLFGSGMVFLLLRQLASRAIEIGATACAAGLILAAHALNIRYLHICRCCDERSRARRIIRAPDGGGSARSSA
jgi:hypothetical protein